MILSHTAVTPIRFLAHNGVDVFLVGSARPGQVVETGQPNLEVFDTLDQVNTRLAELGQPPYVD